MSSAFIGVSWRSTGVRNLARSLRFYRALGLRIAMQGEMDHGGEWVWLRDRRTRQIIELNYYPPRSKYHERYRVGSELDHLGFTVRDVVPLIRRLRRLGHPVVDDFVQGNVRLTWFHDPDGVFLEFLSWTPKARRYRKDSPAFRILCPPRRRTRRG